MSEPSPRVTANKVAALLGVLGAVSAVVCFGVGQEAAGVVSVLVVFGALSWFGFAP